MASFGQDFLQGLGEGFFGSNYIKDYTHASKTFVAGNYALAPRYKFLFHVYFNINTVEIPILASVFPPDKQKNIGLMVKSVQLPTFQIQADTLNQYNRKRVVQKKIDYQPAQIMLHDDGNDLIRTLWYNYFSYYYKDPAQTYWSSSNSGAASGGANSVSQRYNYNARDIYADQRTVNDWGYVGESMSDGAVADGGKPPFFKDITIYGFNQHKYAAYTMINPLITEWNHDTYDYSQGGEMMTNQMTIRYETVKYYSGSIGANTRPDPNVAAFADPATYDTTPSAISAGSGASILGPGGLVDSIGTIVDDLQSGSIQGIIGAVQVAGKTYNTFKNQNISAVVSNEANQLLKTVVQTQLPGVARSAMNSANGFLFPSTPGGSNTTTYVPATPTPATPTQG
jgi:hypothetical protein